MKKRESHKRTKILALLLAAVMTASAAQYSGMAAPADRTTAAEAKSTAKTAELFLKPGDLPPQALKTAVLAKEDTPEIISEEAVRENGHVNRLYKQEPDLNTVVFQNRDGQKTMYIYQYPVKYVDANGEIQDKRNLLTNRIENPEYADAYAYATAQNDIKTYFPRVLSSGDGIVLQGGDVTVTSTPIQPVSRSSATLQTTAIQPEKQSVVVQSKELDQVTYADAFGESTSIQLKPQFEGYKENIILEKAPQSNRFSFKLETNGLRPEQRNEDYFLVDPESGEQKVVFGDILIYDNREKVIEGEIPQKALTESVMHTYDHHYEIQTIVENQEYVVTIVVDPVYLNNSSTVYPVTIDPTLEIVPEGTGAKEMRNFADATICKGTPSTAHGLNKHLYIGNYNLRYPNGTKHGRSRVLIGFPALKGNLAAKNLDFSNITAAQLFLRDVGAQSDAVTIKAYRTTGSWTESTVTANQAWDYRGTSLGSSQSVAGDKGTNRDGSATNSGYWYHWNVLGVIKDFATVGSLRGPMLCSATTQDKAKVFASAQYADNTSYRPYLKLTYRVLVTGITLDKTSAQLDVSGTSTVTLVPSFTPANATNKGVIYSSSDPEVATVSASGVVTGKSTGIATITATASDGTAKKATCTVQVKGAPTKYGEILYENKGWPIYVNEPGIHIGVPWQVYKTVDQSGNLIFDPVRFISGFSVDSDFMTSGGGAGILASMGLAQSFVNMLSGSLDRAYTEFVFSKSTDGKYRKVAIYAGSAQVALKYNEFFTHNIPGAPVSARQLLAGKPKALADLSEAIGELYYKRTGIEPAAGDVFDYEMTLDEGHQNSHYCSFLWTDKQDNLKATNIVLPEDKIEFVKYSTILNLDSGPFETFDLYHTTSVPDEWQACYKKFF